MKNKSMQGIRSDCTPSMERQHKHSQSNQVNKRKRIILLEDLTEYFLNGIIH